MAVWAGDGTGLRYLSMPNLAGNKISLFLMTIFSDLQCDLFHYKNNVFKLKTIHYTIVPPFVSVRLN